MLFGIVHGGVGVKDEVAGLVGATGEEGEAGTGLDPDVIPADLEHKGADGTNNAIRQITSGAGRGARDDDGELVAPEPGEGPTARRHDAREASRDANEQAVAGFVTEVVVDLFESVEVEDHEGDHGGRPPGFIEGGAEELIEAAAVEQPG